MSSDGGAFKTISFKNVLIIGAVLFASLVSLTDGLNSVALYVAIPAAFLVTYDRTRKLCLNRYFFIYLLLCFWLFVTSLVATDVSVAFRELKQVLGAFLLSYVLSGNVGEERVKPWLYWAFIILYLMAINYAVSNILVADWDISQDRMDDPKLNANKLAYYTFYATFALFFLGDLIRKNRVLNRILRILFLLMIPLTFWIAIMTASRQVLLIQIPTISILGYLRYFSGQRLSKIVVAAAVIVLVAFFASDGVKDIYEGSYLKERNEKNLEEDSRPKLMANAVRVGLKHPVFGVGPGNFIFYSYNKHYSHCTYTELFANTGFIGLIIYVVLVIRLLVVNGRRYQKTRDRQYLVYATFALIFIVYNLFYVFYKDMWLTAFFMIVASDSDSYYYKTDRKKRIQLNEN